MTIEQAMELIHGVEWRGSRPGLSRVRELLHRLGDPQDGPQFVHIAGTNGKGSTAAMLASILRAAGYTTGLFTSPYLERFAERMQVNGAPVPDAEFAAVCQTLQPCIAAMDDPPTEFELMTAAAMLWFRRRGCDVVVLEVGLGGRLDATNVIAAPACAVITNIGLDHTEILGGTLAQIAREKAGILKPGTCAVSYPQAPEVRSVLREICAQRGIPLTEADASAIVPLELLLAAPLVAAAFAPDALHHFCLGIAGAAHQDGEVFIVFAHASGLDRGGVDAETQFGGDEAYEFERSPGTEPAVVLVGTFGRCCSAHEDFPEDEAFVAEDGDDMFPIEGYEGFFLAQLRAIDGELYASRCGVEEGIADLWYDGIAVVADIDEGVFSERLVGADLLRRCLHGVEK